VCSISSLFFEVNYLSTATSIDNEGVAICEIRLVPRLGKDFLEPLTSGPSHSFKNGERAMEGPELKLARNRAKILLRILKGRRFGLP
jgi:hypothetical protein